MLACCWWCLRSTLPTPRRCASECRRRSSGPPDKLSAEALARLDAWLAARDAAPAPAAASEDRRGLRQVAAADDTDIVSRIPGNFRGWSAPGEVITLENGQRWRIIQVSGALAVNVDNPVATISPAAFGSWSLRIEGFNARAKVRRVE